MSGVGRGCRAGRGPTSSPGRVRRVPARAVRIVVLASGRGSTLRAILDASTDAGFGGQVVAAGTDVKGCAAMAHAEQHGVATFAVALRDFADREAWNEALGDAIAEYQPDLVVLAGIHAHPGAEGGAPLPDREHTPGIAAVVPRCARGPRHARRGRRASRRHRALGGRGRRHRAGDRPARGARRSPATTKRRSPPASRPPRSRCTLLPSASSARRLLLNDSDSHPPRVDQRLRQDRHRRTRARPARSRRRDRLDRLHGRADP